VRAAVLGRPVGHSLSPLLHRAAYAALDLADWSYDALDIGAEDLPVLLAGLGEEWRGFSVTMPCKQAAVDVADVVATLRDRPGSQHVVITGRDAHPDLVDLADLVTDMTKVKHPMDAGRKGQQGIEW